LTANDRALESASVFEDYEPIRFVFSGDDRLSGMESISAALDGDVYSGGTEVDFAGRLGTHNFTVYAEDRAGNRVEYRREFVIKTSLSSLKILTSRYEANEEIPKPLAGLLLNLLDQAGHKASIDRWDQAVTHLEDILKHIDQQQQSAISDRARGVLNVDVNSLISEYMQKTIN
jgi:hypothetical protein